MSVERQKRKALRRVIFWRILGFPFVLLRTILMALHTFCVEVENTVYLSELDAAREFRLISGYDLGVASGQPSRYVGTTEKAWEAATDVDSVD